MSVHLQIQEQINKHLEAQKEYKRLDYEREEAIEKVLYEAQKGNSFSTVAINQITEKMNNLSKKFGFPLRKNVTKEMIIHYISKKS